MLELMGKCGGVMFSAYRDSDHTYTDQNYVTFSGTNVNIGSGFR